MTTADTFLDARPKLRPEVVLGPAMRRGSRTVHHIKDARTGRFFQIGPREFFIISRLDGRATLDEIGAGYAATYGRRMEERSWDQIIGLLATRRLLSGTADADELDELAESTKAARRAAGRRGWWQRRFPLIDPDRFLGWMTPRLSFAFSPLFVMSALIAIVALEVFVIVRFGTLFNEAVRLWEWPALGVVVVVWIWLGVAAHELAHGLTSKHYGGTAHEIGLIWRFPLLLVPYCKVDDVILFARRRERVHTAFAGVFTSLLLLLPVAPVWMLTSPGSGVRHMTAAMLIFGSLAALLNLVPFFRLDGYFMLTHGLGMQNLSEESRRFLATRIRAWLGRRAEQVSYSRKDAVIYTAYALGSAVAVLALLVWGVVMVFNLLQPLTGTAGALAALGAAVGVGVAVIGSTVVRSRSRDGDVVA